MSARHTVTPRLFRLRYFIWILVPLVIYVVTSNYGLPQFRWSYSWIDQGQGYNPHASRHYTRCTYVGASGPTTLYPLNGRCAVLRLQKPDQTLKTL